MSGEPEETPLDGLERAWRHYLSADFGRLNITAERLLQAAKRCGWTHVEGNFAPWAFAHLVQAGRVSPESSPWS